VAKLYLTFEGNTLKEVAVTQSGSISIGRLPDNHLPVDNLAVSGHHAKVYYEGDHYWVEDNSSLNGTYLNNQRITKSQLKDGDKILVGKHTIEFKDEWHEDNTGEAEAEAGPIVPQMQSTMVLDTKKAKELMAAALAAKAAQHGGAGAAAAPPPVVPAVPPKERTGVLTVLEGKTDESRYVLSSKMIVIGKSAMASIKLKGSLFKSPPDVAAMISKREGKYYITEQDKHTKLKLNGSEVLSGQHEIIEGDTIEVAGVRMTFSWQD
jgi:predicted component of type VI protein secretion system